MHPQLFELFGIPVYSFGAMVALAAIVAMFWIYKRLQHSPTVLHPDETYNLGIICLLGGIVGARITYFIFFPQEFLSNPIQGLLSPGGLVWYGGMILVILLLWVYARIKTISLMALFDLLAPPAALGLAIGRIGCLLAGCCYGGETTLPWAIQYPLGHQTHPHFVHPSPLYESVALILTCLFLNQSDKQKAFQGQTGWLFVGIYGVIRFILEYFRGDRLVWLTQLNLSASQLISIAMLLVAGIFLYALQNNHHQSQQKLGSLE